ncbi:MAG TPA: N-acetylmuramoyl-L-alanine amidase [Streptosporangiaceae bacterium]
MESIGISRFPATGMSYNALCPPSAVLHEGQPLTRRGAHTVNVYEIATCPVHGGSLRATDSSGWNLNYSVRALALCQMLDDPVHDAQIDAAARWGAACIRAGEVKPGARWHGHRDVTNKDCPGAKAYALIPKLQALTEHYVAHGLEEDMPLTQADADLIANTMVNRLLTLVDGSKRSAGNTWIQTRADAAAAAKGVALLLARDPADVDEAALAAALGPLLNQSELDTVLTAIRALPADTVAAIKDAL